MGRLRGGGPGTGAWWDAALYAASAGFSLVAARVFEIPLQREWAGRSWAPYAVGAVAAVLLALRLRRRPGGAGTAARMALAVAVLVGVALVPLAAGIAERAEPGRRAYAHSEVIVTEESARLLLDGRNPYAAVLGGGLENRTDDVRLHVPYLPAMIAFGLPRALFGDGPWTDARLAFAVAGLGIAAAGLRMWPGGARGRLRALQVLLVLPTGAMLPLTSGHDLVVIALLLVAVAGSARGRPVLAGLAAGAAGAMKLSAWPLLPFLVLAARDRSGARASGRLLAAAAAVGLPVCLPFLAWDPGAFVEDVVRFPLGLSTHVSPADDPTPGALLERLLPGGSLTYWAAIGTVLLAVTLGALARARREPDAMRGAATGARLAGAILAAATLLAPAGRPGYLLYPLNLMLWGWLIPARRTRVPAEPRAAPELLARVGPLRQG